MNRKRTAVENAKPPGDEAIGLPDRITRVLHYAAHAPSGHNVQPWLVRVEDESSLTILSDQTRRLLAVDPTNRETFLSLSSFVETVSVAARALGYEVETRLTAQGLKDREVCRVKLKESNPTDEKNLELIEQRATTRTSFDKQRIARPELEKVLASAHENIAYYPVESGEGQWIAQALPQAIEQQSTDNRKQEELAHWLRFSKGEIRQRRDGLTAESLGMGPMGRLMWYVFFNRKTAMGNAFRTKGVEVARAQVRDCSGFLVLTSKDSEPRSLFAAGRVYQQVGLKCTEMGIVHHTMSQLMEEEPWSDEIGRHLELSRPVQFVMRIGYGKPASPSIRRPVRDFVAGIGGASARSPASETSSLPGRTEEAS